MNMSKMSTYKPVYRISRISDYTVTQLISENEGVKNYALVFPSMSINLQPYEFRCPNGLEV